MRLARPLALVAIALAAFAAPAGGEVPMAAKQTKLTLRESPYGRVVFANGFAMYVFTRDEGRRSRCYRSCAEAWPPLRPRGEIVTGAGVDRDLIGRTKRRDGTKQLTLDGKPLYGYVHDPRGRVFCHDVVEFGGTWYAVRGSGKPAP
jgi:predicted lipoprotein with Yx(FWY)xxD motif